MHGTIIHYDPFTQCGLLRTEAGQMQYFRLDEVVSQGIIATGKPVTLRNGVLVDTGGSQFDIQAPNRPLQMPAGQAVPNVPGPYARLPAKAINQVRSGRSVGWIGSLLAVGALILLSLAGGQHNEYASPNPKLIESTFGVAAAVLLVIEALFFISSTGRRGLIRWTFWLIAWASLFAYVGQTFDGFEADEATGWYAYALLTLGFAVYVLPYRTK